MYGLLIKFGLALTLIGGLFFYGRHVGYNEREAKYQREVADAVQLRDKIDDKNTAISVEARHDNDVAQTEIKWKTRILTERVVSYVTPAADHRCVVPDGFVRLYDQAVAGEPGPAPVPGGLEDGDSGIPLSVVAETDIYNLGVCQSLKAEVNSWRGWYAKIMGVAARPSGASPAATAP